MNKSLLLICLLLLTSSLASAGDKLRVSGFGTLGSVYVESDVYGYRKDISQEDGVFDGDFDLTANSVLGVQLDYRLLDELDFSYQAIYRNQNDLDFNNATNLAFLRYSPSATWSFRLGRIGYDLFHLTEYRDIGFAYIWAKAPTEVYGIIPNRNLDGGDLSYTRPLGNVTFNFKFAYGIGESDVVGYETNQPEEIEIEDVFNTSLSLEALDWTLKARYTTVRLANNIQLLDQLIAGLALVPPIVWPDAGSVADGLGIKGTSANYSSISGSYNIGDFVLMAEVSHIEGESLLIRDLDNGYISASYLMDDHTFYVTYGRTRADEFQLSDQLIQNVPAQLQPLLFGVNTALSFLASNQESYSLGWRWNFRENLALKVQWEHTDIEENGGTLWRKDPNVLGLPADSVDSLFINLDFIF